MRDLLGIDAAWGITVVGVMIGLVFALHGYQKFSSGIGVVVASFTKMGIPAPQVTGPFIAGLELIGGICLIVGLLTRFGVLFSCEMLVTALLIQLPMRGWNASELDRMLLVSCTSSPRWARQACDRSVVVRASTRQRISFSTNATTAQGTSRRSLPQVQSRNVYERRSR
jgi:uncharacterized membrane protein YphA (DoxX/SURF4 family)